MMPCHTLGPRTTVTQVSLGQSIVETAHTSQSQRAAMRLCDNSGDMVSNDGFGLMPSLSIKHTYKSAIIRSASWIAFIPSLRACEYAFK
jgi:hypothetical protein